MGSKWRVHKFGGTSLANAERYRRAAGLVRAHHEGRSAVVVSAMAGVTDLLLGLVKKACARDLAYRAELQALGERVRGVFEALLPEHEAPAYATQLQRDLDDIENLLRALWLLRSPPARASDMVAGYGELWSARTLAGHLDAQGVPTAWLDAREALVVEPGALAPYVDRARSSALLDGWLEQHPEAIVVITGFIASDKDGLACTLGRNGSDYSAAIFASLLDGTRLDIWTDVSGVMSADPRLVREAVAVDRLSYDEAMELAYFGAKVIHPSTMTPAVEKKIPIHIRNTFAPDDPGTLISAQTGGAQDAKGFATLPGMALINVEGSSMIGVPGIAERLFSALREAQVSVVLISQGSSEHSICFAVQDAQADRAQEAVEQAFFAERQRGQIQRIEVERDCAVLAVVGDKMAGSPGVAAKFFGALGRAGVNIRAIAQGSSERNISAVVKAHEATRALRAVHSGFYLSNLTLSVGLVGPGLVGGTLLAQLEQARARLIEERGIDLRVRGIISSTRMLLSEEPIELGTWKERFEAQSEPADLERFSAHLRSELIPHAAIVDCSSSELITESYAAWLERGIHVVTPNKKAASGDWNRYQAVHEARKTAHFLYETNVGAGLPIIETLRDLIQTGDEVLRIEGILSGTLAYLFNAYDGRQPFSEVVRAAKESGYTEPDPRDDLLGTDVARKLVILAREMGASVSLDDVEVESLVPQSLAEGSTAQFLERAEAMDAPLAARFDAARQKGQVLRYIGTIERDGRASARLVEVPMDHPCSQIRLTDNLVQFQTRRYFDNPLIVQGPGAGPEVTAGGVFADLLRLARYLGASR